jgi:hypothetical protein
VDLKALTYGTLPIHEQTAWNPPNLDVALSSRLKIGDFADTITLGRVRIHDGTNPLPLPAAGEAVGRGILIYGSDYSAAPGPYARVAKVDSSGRLSCVLG